MGRLIDTQVAGGWWRGGWWGGEASAGCSRDQRSDLDRQVAGLRAWATVRDVEVGQVVCEVGSGLNGKRPKLRRILSDPDAMVIVVEHRDRLARFGVEHLQAALSGAGPPDRGRRSG